MIRDSRGSLEESLSVVGPLMLLAITRVSATMSVKDLGTELVDTPCQDSVPVATETKAVFPSTDPCSGSCPERIKEPLGDVEENPVGELEQRGTLSPTGIGGVTTDDETARDRNDDDVTTTSSMTAASKRNKRKMTEPRRRRTDFSIRSLCSHSDDDEEEKERVTRGEERTGKRTKRKRDYVTAPSSSSSSSHLPWSASTAAASSLLSSFSLDPSAAAAFDRPSPGTPSMDDRRPAAASSPPPLPSFPFGGYTDAPPPPPCRPQRKNYKNMTKQRRIEANARERTRVHTISAAFESLRRAVPSYSYNQRLSKLAILKIASSYILALATLAELDYAGGGGGGGGQKGLTFGDCVDLCTQTIQAEGRAKRRH